MVKQHQFRIKEKYLKNYADTILGLNLKFISFYLDCIMSLKINSKIKCLTEVGETDLPSIVEIKSFKDAGKEPVIFIDSCVCLDIIKVVDYGKKATNVDISKILRLKEYLSKNPIKIDPLFGIAELCLKNGEFDKVKFSDFKHRISFFEQIPLKEFKKFKYSFKSDYYILKDFSKTLENPYGAFEPSLMNSYCSLLKIRSLAIHNPGKEFTMKNISVFLDWMIKDLKIIRGSEYYLALNLFNGKTEYRKMIGQDSSEIDAKKKILGTTWDLFHTKHLTNSFRLYNLLGENIFPYFLTFDSYLFKLHKELNLALIIDKGEDFSGSFLLSGSYDKADRDIGYLDELNEKMFDQLIKRRNKKYIFCKERTNRLIKKLEIENGFNNIKTWQ